MIEVLVPIAIILMLVVLNGLFVAAEFAIVGAPKPSIEHQAAQGSLLARSALRILEDPKLQDRYIATTQIGISVASLGLGMYGEHWMSDHIAQWLGPLETTGWIAAHTVASVIAVAILTYLHIVYGEMLPKALALQRSQKTILYISPVIRGLERALLPLVVSLNAFGNWLLKLVGIKRQRVEGERYHTAEELQFIVQESEEGGLLRGEAGQLLRDLFEFGDRTAGEAMVPRVLLVGIPIGAEPDELRAIVRAQAHTRYPVYSGDLDHIVGSLHIKEVLRHLISNEPVTARDARALPYVPGPTPVDEVLAAMRRYRAQMAVVMDQHGGTAGLVTMEDLFEEVIGDIEEGRGRAAILREPDGRVRVRGTVRLDEIAKALDWPLEHPKVTTISGLVLLLLGRPALLGDVVLWNQVRVEVTRVAGRGVAEALLTRTSHPPS
ncbi:MAG TPA: hemolysin family protein [Vicinamibacterales bacterium]|jgi:CBS domain containing-hemolysin-like protein|nr:hemolysin family protein [Vicinamibacterales bacterium]